MSGVGQLRPDLSRSSANTGTGICDLNAGAYACAVCDELVQFKEVAINDNKERPTWFTRREISPFTLSDEAVEDILGRAMHAVVSWVTKDNQPVSSVMTYVLIDGLITVTATTNRAKYHAWRRNPAACFCIWDPETIGRQITLRGHVEIIKSDDLLRRFTEAFLAKRNAGAPPSEEQLAAEIAKFDAPDRHMMQLHVEKVLTHDLHRLFEVETKGLDVWS